MWARKPFVKISDFFLVTYLTAEEWWGEDVE